MPLTGDNSTIVASIQITLPVALLLSFKEGGAKPIAKLDGRGHGQIAPQDPPLNPNSFIK